MSEEWGPWIEHDGSGCPIKRGELAEIVWADGTSVIAFNSGQSAKEAGVNKWRPYSGPLFASSWVWSEIGTKIPVARYRICKPRGLIILESLLQDLPAPVREGVDA